MSRHPYWIASLLFAALVLAKFDPETGFTSLIRFGETWADRRHSSLHQLPIATVANSNGYDGQFYAQIALDPLLRSPEFERILDLPAYRANRILTPAVATLLGFGLPWWTLQAYALLNVACWFALGWLLRDSIGAHNWIGFARWAGCMFGMGVLDSVRQSLVDLPAMLLLSLAIRTYAQPKVVRTSLWLALANLAKETSLLGTFALLAEAFANKSRRRRAFLGLLVATIPLGLWWLYVHWRFGGAAAAAGLGNFTWPLLSLLHELQLCVHELLQGKFDSRYTFGLIAIVGLVIQAVVLWRTPNLPSPWWRIGAAYALLLPFLGLWVWSGYWAACRAVLPMTIAYNLLLPANRGFWPLWIVGNLPIGHAIWRFL